MDSSGNGYNAGTTAAATDTGIAMDRQGALQVNGLKQPKPMDDEDFQAVIFTWATDARNYGDEFVALERAESTHYYKGRLPDIDIEDAEEDRSTAVITEVRDTVLSIMPEIMRVFFASDAVVKYEPAPHPDPQVWHIRELQAKQATDYVHQVVLGTDNPEFFRTMYDCFQDALVRKTGMLRWDWETEQRPQYTQHTALSEPQAEALVSDPDVEVLGKREYTINDPYTGAQLPVMDLQLKRIEETGYVCIRAIPCEHMVVARRNFGNIDHISLFGFTEDKRAGEFLDAGLIDDLADLAHCDNDINDADNIETQARQVRPMSFISSPDNTPEDPSTRLVKYSEFYVRIDFDGDGIPELRKVVCAGTRYLVLSNEPADEVNYAAFCPYPEAHAFFGECIADLTKDIQRIKSRIVRDTLDSLAQSVQPIMSVVDGQVNLDDVLNDDASRIIRMRQPGMVAPITMPFVGKEALPVIEYLTSVREQRTGQSDASNGLGPEAMQSTTASAIAGTLSKAQSRTEMVCRIFAETGMKRLFRGVLNLIVRNQDPRMVLLGGKPSLLDPKSWDAAMSVKTTLVFGRGDTAQQIQALMGILGKQEQLMQELGFENPICDMDNYSYTLAKLVELAGWTNTTSFFKDTSQMSPQAKQQFIQQYTQSKQAAAAAGKGQNPQIEMAKIQSDQMVEKLKLQADMVKHQAEMQLEQLKIRGQLDVAMLEALSDHTNTQDANILQAIVDRSNAQLDAFVNAHGNVLGHMSDLQGHAVAHDNNQQQQQITQQNNQAQQQIAKQAAANQGGGE